MKNLGTPETNLNNRIQKMKERILGSEITTKDMATLVKEDIKSKRATGIKHPGNLRDYKKIKYKNNRNRGKRRNPDKRHRKYFQQNNRKKFP